VQKDCPLLGIRVFG